MHKEKKGKLDIMEIRVERCGYEDSSEIKSYTIRPDIGFIFSKVKCTLQNRKKDNTCVGRKNK